MELREILNRTEGLVINAKSFQAGGNVAQVQSRLLDLKSFLNRELVNQPAEPSAEPPAEPSAESLAKPAEPSADEPAEQPHESPPKDPPGSVGIKPFKLSESKDGAGVVSEPAEQESKPGSGVVKEPDKSQNKPGSGVV